jgi:hypothetical protein
MENGNKNRKKDIRAAGTEDLSWDTSTPATSLQALRTFVEDEALKATDWYWREKNIKKAPSQVIRFLALVLTAGAGLAPIAIQLVKNSNPARFDRFDSGPVASLLVGLAAALLGLDKAFGYSTGWTRYVLTATSMNKLLHEFRMDWVAIYAGSAVPPTPEQQASLIQRSKQFVSAVQDLLLQETKDWAAEFQSNLAQMEKDVKTQLDALKAQVEKFSKEREEATRPAAVELTVTNADMTDGFHFDAVLEGTQRAFPGSVSNSKIWTEIDIPPGQYKLRVDAKFKGNPVSTSMILEVKPADTAKPSVTLPVP